MIETFTLKQQKAIEEKTKQLREILDGTLNPKGISTEMISENLLRIESRNFCPYLEACQWLGMDTRFVCKEIGEPSIIAFFHEISPYLDFYRNYDKIRPYSDYCEEFMEEIK